MCEKPQIDTFTHNVGPLSRIGRKRPRGLRLIIRSPLWAFLLLPLFCCPARAEEKPEAFPTVELIPDAKPLYAAVSIDPWDDNRLAYLLFDGNLEQGYGRLYVWIPGDREYGRPVARQANREMNFPLMEFRPRSPAAGLTGGEEALLAWNLSYRRRSHGGRRRSFNYARGVYVETDRPVTYSPVVIFNLGYGLGPRDGSTRTLARMPLSLNIPGELTLSEYWDKVGRGVRPWNNLNFTMQRSTQREGRRADVRFVPRIQYRSGGSWRNVTVTALPPTATVSLSVSPYMKEPIISNEMPADQAFRDGQAVSLPYSWYEYAWNMECPGLMLTSRHPSWQPHPLSADDFED